MFAEKFKGGTFYACSCCGLHYAETSDHDLQRYYGEIWSEGNLGNQGYEEKVRAASDPARLDRLVREIPRYSWVAAQLRKFDRGSKILDVGCGEGTLLWVAQNLKHRPYGCDLSPAAVSLARGLVGGEDVHVGTVHDLPYESHTFDCVLALEILEHLPSPQPFLERLAYHLKPGGILLLTVPNRNRLFAAVKRLLGRPHSSTDYPPHHYTRWSSRVLVHFLEQYFDDVRVGSLRYHFHRPIAQLLSYPLHLATVAKIGQSLWVRAVGRPSSDSR